MHPSSETRGTVTQETRGHLKYQMKQTLNALSETPYPDQLSNYKVEQVWEFVTTRYSEGPRSTGAA